jgi:hypothetical protein
MTPTILAAFLSDWSAEMREDNDRAQRIAHCRAKLDEIAAKMDALDAAGKLYRPGCNMLTHDGYLLNQKRVTWLAAQMKARKS